MRTKEKLIEKILHIDDESVLEDIMRMVDMELNLGGDIVTLSEEQKNCINDGLEDIRNGNLISDEAVKLKSKEWFKNRSGGR